MAIQIGDETLADLRRHLIRCIDHPVVTEDDEKRPIKKRAAIVKANRLEQIDEMSELDINRDHRQNVERLGAPAFDLRNMDADLFDASGECRTTHIGEIAPIQGRVAIERGEYRIVEIARASETMLRIRSGDAYAFQVGELVSGREQKGRHCWRRFSILRNTAMDIEEAVHGGMRLGVIGVVGDRRDAFDISPAVIVEGHAPASKAHSSNEVLATGGEKVLNRGVFREFEAERIAENLRGVEPVIRETKPAAVELPPTNHRRVELRRQVRLDHFHCLGLVDRGRIERDLALRRQATQIRKPSLIEQRAREIRPVTVEMQELDVTAA